MEVWRVCRRPFADLTGEGARRFGGRWNRKGWPVVYFAEHPALAVLEVLVHLDLPIELLPDDYVLLRAEVPFRPAEVVIQPGDDPARLGDAWLKEGQTPLLRVPSIVVPHGRNLLLNPAHKASARARILSVEPFAFGARLGAAA